MKIVELLAELKDALERLDYVYKRRDDNIRETNELMITEHNIRAQIQRINLDLVQGG